MDNKDLSFKTDTFEARHIEPITWEDFKKEYKPNIFILFLKNFAWTTLFFLTVSIMDHLIMGITDPVHEKYCHISLSNPFGDVVPFSIYIVFVIILAFSFLLLIYELNSYKRHGTHEMFLYHLHRSNAMFAEQLMENGYSYVEPVTNGFIISKENEFTTERTFTSYYNQLEAWEKDYPDSHEFLSSIKDMLNERKSEETSMAIVYVEVIRQQLNAGNEDILYPNDNTLANFKFVQ